MMFSTRRLRSTGRTVKRILSSDARGNPVITNERRRVSRGLGASPIRIAIIGAGTVAHHHLKVLKAFDDVEIVGLANRGRTDISSPAHQYGIDRTFGDWRKMLEATSPDAVFVLVSVTEIADVSASVLEMGFPCLIEKPAGLTSKETARLADLAAKSGCLNMVGLNRRYYSSIDNALSAIYERGPLMGIVVEANEPIESLRRNSRHNSDVIDRWLIANSIHPIDLIRRCCGEVRQTDTLRRAWKQIAPDSYNSSFATERGVLGTFIAHWQSVPGWRLSLYGDGVRIALSPLEQGEIIYSNGDRKAVPVDEVDLKFKPGFYAQDAAFLESLANHEPALPPGSDLADQVQTMQLIEGIAGYPGSR